MKKFLSVIAAAVLALSFSACSGQTGQTAPPESDSGSDGQTGQTAVSGSESGTLSAGSYSHWDGIERDKVIAYVDGADKPEDFNITFGDFYSEYLYYLLSYGIPDDMSSTYREGCKTYRDEIITYLQFEKIFLRVAEEEGVGVSSLTEQELSQIQESADTTYDSFLAKYYSAAAEELGEDASQEALRKREEELLKADLERAELTDAIFFEWEQNAFIQEKLLTKLTEEANIEITDAQVDEMYAEYVQMAKDALAEDPLSYESNSTYTWIYVPEGTRLADQILLMFDEDTRSAVSEARKAGNDEEADRLRQEAYESQLKEKAESVLALIESGSDFDELQKTYNEDGANDPYAVIPGAKRYVSEFTDAVFSISEIGGVSAPAVSDYGVHIIKYVGDDSVTEQELAEIRESMKGYLEYQEKTAVQEAAYSEWTKRFPYTVDYETLKLDAPEAAQEQAD